MTPIRRILYLLLLSPSSALAQAEPTQQQPTGASTVLPGITVTAPAALEAQPTDAASERRISGETLNERPVQRPGEMLEAVPGLIVTQHSGEGKANQYFLRGFNLDHGTDLAIWLDGMPINMRTHGHAQGYADINFLIPELVQSMLVRKGRTGRRRATSRRWARCGWPMPIDWKRTWCWARVAASATG